MNFKLLKVKNLLILSIFVVGVINTTNASEIDGNDEYSYNSQNISENDKKESNTKNDFKLINDSDYQNYNDNKQTRKKIRVTRESKENKDLSSSDSYDDDNADNNTVIRNSIKPRTIKDKIIAKKNNACIGEGCNNDNNNTASSYVMSSSSYYSSDMNGNTYSSYSNYQNQSSMKDGQLVSSDIKAGAGFNDNGYTRDADVFSKYNNKKGMDAGGNSYENGKQTDHVRQHYTVNEAKCLLCDGSDCSGKELIYAGLEYLNKSLGYNAKKCVDGDKSCMRKKQIAQAKDNYKENIDLLYGNKNALENNKALIDDNEYDKPLVTDTVETKSNFDDTNNKLSLGNNTIPLLADKPALKGEEYKKFQVDNESENKMDTKTSDNKKND